MNVLICASHSIEEFDQVRLFDSLGYGVFSMGAYIDPEHPHDRKRPALPDVPFHADLKKAVDDAGGNDRAQSLIPSAVLQWLGDDGVIFFHHQLDRLIGQWGYLRNWQRGAPGRRIVWRTVGQSNPDLEETMAQLRRDGLEIVRYSPKERNMPNYAGEDALIRFYKDPADWYGWTGDKAVVGNVTQNMDTRGAFCGWDFWQEATKGLPTLPAGPGSERFGGLGELPYDEMRQYLRDIRVYLYTGTQPASYTLGLIEAMMTGVPIVSIGPSHMWIPGLFEGHELGFPNPGEGEDPDKTRDSLAFYLDHPNRTFSGLIRYRAIELFGRETIAAQWQSFLSAKVLAHV